MLPGDMPTSRCAMEELYEIEKCARWIKQHRFKKVALQFPDELLCDSARIVTLLTNQTNVETFVLADTCYGSCCVDEIAAQHYDADSIIHFGRACLSPTLRLPVLYVFGTAKMDVAAFCQKFRTLLPDRQIKILLIYDAAYHTYTESIKTLLGEDYPNLFISALSFVDENSPECDENSEVSSRTSEFKPLRTLGRIFYVPKEETLENYSFFYIGAEGKTLTNYMMTYNKCRFYSYDPNTDCGRLENVSVNKLLMKRYYMVEKAKDASIVGILVGTLGVSDYLQIITRLQDMLSKSGKKSYTFVMGRISPEKLANFPEVDVFVLVACPENSLVDSSDFYRPIVTPYEMEIACNRERIWDGSYVTNFRELLPGGKHHVEIPANLEDDETDVSLVTGKLRQLTSEREEADNEPCLAIVERNQRGTLSEWTPKSAGDFLSQRSWQGLDQQLGQTPVGPAQEGTEGVAMSYSHEPCLSSKDVNE